MDLIMKKLDKRYHLGREIKRALIAQANGYEYIAPDYSINGYNEITPKSLLINLSFETTKPEELATLEMMKKIEPGDKCDFIKAVYRASCKTHVNFLLFPEAGVVRCVEYGETNEASSVSNDYQIPIKEQPKEMEPVIPAVSNEPGRMTVISQKGEPEEQNLNENDDFDSLFGALDALGH